MNHRSRIATTAALLLFLLVSVLAVRGAVRGLNAPFEGLERLAQSRKAAPPQLEPTIEETVRAIDWEVPVPGPPVRMADAASKPSCAGSTVENGDVVLAVRERLAAELSNTLILRVDVGDQLESWISIGNEIDIDSLASTLKLSDSQKARIAGLMEWRRWWLDRISDADKANAESMKKFDDSFNEAVKMELDQEQAQAYQKMRTSRLQVVELRGAAQTALDQIQTDSKRTWATIQLKQYKKTVK